MTDFNALDSDGKGWLSREEHGVLVSESRVEGLG